MTDLKRDQFDKLVRNNDIFIQWLAYLRRKVDQMAGTQKQLQDSLTKLQTNVDGLKGQIAANAAPDLQPQIDAANALDSEVTEIRAALNPPAPTPAPAASPIAAELQGLPAEGE